MDDLFSHLDEVEPLIVVASLILTAGVFIYTLVTVEETAPFPRHVIVSNNLARLFCIPLPVIATIIALVYACVPCKQWLTVISFVLIVLDLLVVLAFSIIVLPQKVQEYWSIGYLLPRFEKAQSTDLQEITPQEKKPDPETNSTKSTRNE